MVLFANCILLALFMTSWLWQQPNPARETTVTQRLVEFVCLAPLCCWVVTLWVGMIAWLFFIGDNGSLFHDFFHYGTFSAGLGLAAYMAFGLVKKSSVQWGLNVAASLIGFAIVTLAGYSLLPKWDGISADAAALRVAHSRPVVANQLVVPTSQYSLVPTDSPLHGGPYSSFDRTFFLIGPNQDAIGRVVVRPFLPLYWTRKRSDNYAYAEQELQEARTTSELLRVIHTYPRSKAAAAAEMKYDQLTKRR